MVDKETEKQIARKIQGWLPDDNPCLSNIANKLRFIGISLSTPDSIDGLFPEDFYGAGDILLSLANELFVYDRNDTEFSLKLCELTTGRKLNSVDRKLRSIKKEAPEPGKGCDTVQGQSEDE